MLRFRSKRILGRCLSYTGLPWLRWRVLPWGLYCFNFHRIGDAASCPYDREAFSCSTEQFEQVVRLLKARFEIVSLNELRGQHARQKIGRRPLALLTFDDGYYDNLEQAFPVLRRHGVSAVFFLPTAFISNTALPWWDEIAWCIRNATVPAIALPETVGEIRLVDGGTEGAIHSVLRAVASRRDVPMEESVAEIRDLTGCPPRKSMLAEAPLLLSWADVRTLARAGMDIGSHTHSHRILAHLSPEDQEQELKSSKQLLESNIGAEIQAVAYPVGGRGTFTGTTIRLAREAGYAFGFSFFRGPADLPLTDPWAIPRFSAGGLRSSRTLILRVTFGRLRF